MNARYRPYNPEEGLPDWACLRRD